MKYIQHLTCSGDDEKHQQLIARAGLAGYGAYWLILEKIASQIRKGSVSTSLTMPWRSWGHLLRIDQRSARHHIHIMKDVRLFLIREDAGNVTINAPNLLKYADEYTKRIGMNSGYCPDNVGTLSVIQNLTELNKNKNTLSPSATASGERVSVRRKRQRASVEYPPEFQEFWGVYPRPVAKQVAFQKWQSIVKAGYPIEHLLLAAREYAAKCAKQGTEERFVLHASTFLSKDRWKDFVFVEDAGGV